MLPARGTWRRVILMAGMGRFLIGAGIVLIALGALVMLGERVGIRLGRLPGDIRIEGSRGGFYFPIVTCLLLSALLSLLGWLFSKH
jgi:hypothetical protein